MAVDGTVSAETGRVTSNIQPSKPDGVSKFLADLGTPTGTSSSTSESKPQTVIDRTPEEQAAFEKEMFPRYEKGVSPNSLKHAHRPWGSVEARAMERGRMILRNELKKSMAAGRKLLENAFRDEIDASTPKTPTPAEPPTASEPGVKPKRKNKSKTRRRIIG